MSFLYKDKVVKESLYVDKRGYRRFFLNKNTVAYGKWKIRNRFSEEKRIRNNESQNLKDWGLETCWKQSKRWNLK